MIKKIIYLSVIAFGLSLVTPAYAQEGIRENFILGNKVSPYARGLDATGKLLSASVFWKAGYGYENNIYQAPQTYSPGVGLAADFPPSLYMPQSGNPFSNVFGTELASSMPTDHYFRLMLAGQFNTYKDQETADMSSFNSYFHHRWDISREQRLDLQLQLDRVFGTATYIFGIPMAHNYNDFLRMEGFLEYHLQTLNPSFIGRGITQLMVNMRYLDYDDIKRDISVTNHRGNTLPLATSSINDTLAANYYQYRIRLRHIQGLVKGYTVRVAGDYIKREYLNHWARKVANSEQGVTMGYIPVDTDGAVIEGHPKRANHELRFYLGLQYDPPHVRNLRFSVGGENTRWIDDFEGFYSWNQYAVRLSGHYRPDPLRYIEASLRVSHREYEELLSNYQHFYPNPPRHIEFDGAPVESGDLVWHNAPLQTNMFEFSLNGQVPLTRFMALWALYNVDSRHTSRPLNQYFSREYFSQSISGGVTVFLELLGNSDRVITKKRD